MIPRGLLLVLGMVALFLAIFVPLAMRINGGRDRTIEADRLRRTYVALAIYETTHDGMPAPNLGLVLRDVDPFDLQSLGDPHVGGSGPFPLDPFCPTLALKAPSRVSWSYRAHWPEAKPLQPLDPRVGLLADPWLGLRVAEDGSIREMPVGGKGFAELFGK